MTHAPILPYGSEAPARASLAAMAEGRALSAPGAPVAACAAGAVLRMSDLAHPFSLPPMPQDLSHADRQLAFLEAHVGKLCGLFAAPRTGFVGRYFAAVRAQIEARANDLDRRTGALAGLVEPLHWAFAAPMPLPRAHIPHEDRMIPVDIAFWTGDGLTLVETGTGSRTPRRQADLASLEAAGATVLTPPAGAEGAALLAALGPAFEDFTEGVTLPESPFRGRGIAAPA